MNSKIIELAEYQTKTSCLEDHFSNDETEYEEDNILKELKLENKDRQLVYDLKKKNILIIKELKNGLEISSKSHIGVVQFANFTVKILPKFALKPTSLPKIIAYSYDLDDVTLPSSEINFESDENYLIDILIFFFIRKCQNLLRSGLLKSYILYENDSKFLRGKLLIQKQIIHNIQHRPLFACEFDELEYNNIENQILLYTLKQSYRLTQSDSLRKDIRILIRQFSDRVDEKIISSNDFNSVTYNRLNKHYESIHDLCKIIISKTGISNFYESKKHVGTSFFVDMNLIFEKFVTRLFKDFYNSEYFVEDQKNKKAWITDEGAYTNIRTDILLSSPMEKKIVIDTKYKRKISHTDSFQIFFYVHEYNEKKGYALLPLYLDSKKSENMTAVVSGLDIDIRRIDLEKTLDWIYSEPRNKSQLNKMLLELIPAN
ncbi:MAG: hypothetical protein HOB51_01595 [Thaumarchaeota archaeon]|nr:hypothetical protein [Nitrososphaerota archaeon]